MHFNYEIWIAGRALATHRLRTFLTVTGIAVSVAAVISIVTVQHGASLYIDEHLNTLNAHVLTISREPTLITSYADYARFKHRKIITSDMFDTFQTICRLCESVGAAQATIIDARLGSRSSSNVTLRGWTLDMPTLASIDLAEGRYFTVHEDHYASRVAVLGPDVSDALIRTGDPLGSSIRVGGLIYTVIGVAERRGKSLGASQDNYIVIPLLTFQRTYGSSASLTIYEKAYPLDVGLADASDEAQLLMRRIRRDTLGADNSFTVETNNTLIALMRRLAQLFAAVAVPIACTSLIVGGVVTMNMMLVSVTERTKEIGLRKALGARRSSIQLQFLIESSVMALAGGTLGVMIGIGVGSAISNYAGFPMRPAWWSIFAGLLMSTIIGLTFGVYPARRAAMLDPIEAMGRE